MTLLGMRLEMRRCVHLQKRSKREQEPPICGRLAGDEFVIVITHVSAENIEWAVNRFREQFSRLWFPFAGHSISLTATFGVAGTEWGKQKSFAELLRGADEMLYEAKRGGRNRVRVRKLENALLEPLGTEKGNT